MVVRIPESFRSLIMPPAVSVIFGARRPLGAPVPKSRNHPMSRPQNNEARYDWAGTRGEHWLKHVAGFEGMFECLDRPLLDALRLDRRTRIAEIGSGGGALTRKLARLVPDGSQVDGFDVSASLVEYANERAGDSGAVFRVADMATARPPAGPYDQLVSRLGVMFFGDDEAAFLNLRSWLRPGGRFAFAVWGSIEVNAWSTHPDEAVEGWVDLPEAEEGGPGPDRYADAERLTSLLMRCGFVDLVVEEWRGSIPVGGGLDAVGAARFVLRAFASLSKALDEKGGDARERAEEILAARWRPYEQGGRVLLPGLVNIVQGSAEP